jgi:hypothetical protein
MRQPSVFESSAAMTRLMMSGGVPGPVGTTMRMTPAGKASDVAKLSELANSASADAQ